MLSKDRNNVKSSREHFVVVLRLSCLIMAKSSVKKSERAKKVTKNVKAKISKVEVAKTPEKGASGDGSEDEPGEESTSLPFSDPPLPDIDNFVKLYPLYNHIIVTIYQIVRDLHIKQEVTGIEILNGSKWNRNQYFIRATNRSTGRKRLLIPIHLDEEIDLPWIHKLTAETEKEGMDLFMCLHTPESIIYETLHTTLP